MRFLTLAASAALFLTAGSTAVLADHHMEGEKAAAEAPTVSHYAFDKAHTQILFFINHLGFSNSQGEFLDYDGQFVIDEENPENSNVEVDIKVAGLDLDDDKWNEHVLGADFFDAETYPSITFKSTDVKLTGDNTAEVTGDLTMHGVTKPVTLHMTHNKSGVHPYSGKYVAGFSGETTVKRSDFGMTYGLPGIGDDVHIRLEVEGIRQ